LLREGLEGAEEVLRKERGQGPLDSEGGWSYWLTGCQGMYSG